MPKHQTPQELEEENQKLLQDLDNPPKIITEEITEEEEAKLRAEEEKARVDAEVKAEEERKAEAQAVQKAKEEEEAKKKPKEEPKKEEEKPQATPSPDYKKKFSESSKEAQKIVAKNRKLNQAIDEADEVVDPTEDELKVEYPEWEFLDETNKKIAKDNLVNKRRFEIISKGRQEARKIEKWDVEINTFVENPQTLIDNPELEGNVDEFRVFATDEKYINVPFNVLVNSFLYEQSKVEKPKQKGEMFPSGSGGLNEKPQPKSDKISVAESEVLRKTDYKRYKELLTAGKIDNTVI